MPCWPASLGGPGEKRPTSATAAFGQHDAGRYWGGTGRMTGHGGKPFLLLLLTPTNAKSRRTRRIHFQRKPTHPPVLFGGCGLEHKGRMPALAWPWMARSTAADFGNRHDAVLGGGPVAVAGKHRKRQGRDIPRAVALPVDEVSRSFLIVDQNGF
jgi:hypothetical protein